MVAKDRAPSPLWKQPLIFLWSLAMRSARSASLFENGTSRSLAKRVASVLQLRECERKIEAVLLDGVTVTPDRCRVGGEAGGSQGVVTGEEAAQHSTGQVALALRPCCVCGIVHLGEQCCHVVGPALVPADPDCGQIPKE